MGKDVSTAEFTPADRRRYREKLSRCLSALDRMLAADAFDAAAPKVGMELELYLVNAQFEPSMNNAAVLDAIADPQWQTELGKFNVELNTEPRIPARHGFAAFRAELVAHLEHAEAAAAALDTHLVMVGILPTLQEQHIGPDSMSPSTRYEALNDQILAARGEELRIVIADDDRLVIHTDSVAHEAACTSAQFHVQVAADRFADYWNAAQAVAAVQVALGANSPLLYGHRLWAETRVPLFEQAVDSRPEELKVQGVRPRVWFGERWIDSVYDLFEENGRYFPPLLPECEDLDPMAVLDAGGVPGLDELTLHNGTVYRWNRPVYSIDGGVAHLRVENRVLPAGPTVADTVANGAFFFGLVRALAASEPVWTDLDFDAAHANFRTAARRGLDATLVWPGHEEIGVVDLVLRRLLPLAATGLDDWGVDPAERDWALGIIEGRCTSRRNGASWQLDCLAELEGSGLDRDRALHELTQRYHHHMHAGDPVHTWPLG
jgi:gamma-glutamyl:cysteine ligase YbdK (ATP-grasp superfamily)